MDGHVRATVHNQVKPGLGQRQRTEDRVGLEMWRAVRDSFQAEAVPTPCTL